MAELVLALGRSLVPPLPDQAWGTGCIYIFVGYFALIKAVPALMLPARLLERAAGQGSSSNASWPAPLHSHSPPVSWLGGNAEPASLLTCTSQWCAGLALPQPGASQQHAVCAQAVLGDRCGRARNTGRTCLRG